MSDVLFIGCLIILALSVVWWLICGVFLHDEWLCDRKSKDQRPGHEAENCVEWPICQ